MPVAVAIGFVALAGVAAETLVVVLIYLEQAMAELKAERVAESRLFCRADLQRAIMLGAVERVRPKMVTAVAIRAGPVPILWGPGAGSEVSKRQSRKRVG